MRNPVGATGAAFAGMLAVVSVVSALALSVQAGAAPVDTKAVAEIQPAAAPAIEDTAAKPVKLVKTTPESLLVALLRDLPKGKTSNYAGNKASKSGTPVTTLMAQTYLDTGRGPGMLRLALDHETPSTGAGSSRKIADTKAEAKFTKDKYGIASKAWREKDGDILTVMLNPDNCIQSLVVYRESSDGLIVQLAVADCLAWDGKENAKARKALTEKQALAVVADERLDLKMPKKLVTEGAKRFPNLPSIS